jgi:hypothetical protein
MHLSSSSAARVRFLAARLKRTERDPSLGAAVRVRASHPLKWVAPNLVRSGQRAQQPVLLRSAGFLDHPRIRVEQDDRVLATYGLRRMVPNRSHRIPSDWQHAVDHHGGDVLVSVSARGQPAGRTSMSTCLSRPRGAAGFDESP